MGAMGTIRDLVIRSAGQRGLGVMGARGRVIDSVVEAAGVQTTNTWPALYTDNATEGSYADGVTLFASGCQYAVETTGLMRLGDISILTDATTANYLVATNTIFPHSFMVSASAPGTLSVGAGAFKFALPYSARVIAARAAVGTAPTGANLIVDINKNGTTIYTTQANRPTVVAGGTVGTLAIPDTPQAVFIQGDYITVDIDQIGSTVAGADLTVVIQMQGDV